MHVSQYVAKDLLEDLRNISVDSAKAAKDLVEASGLKPLLDNTRRRIPLPTTKNKRMISVSAMYRTDIVTETLATGASARHLCFIAGVYQQLQIGFAALSQDEKRADETQAALGNSRLPLASAVAQPAPAQSQLALAVCPFPTRTRNATCWAASTDDTPFGRDRHRHLYV